MLFMIPFSLLIGRQSRTQTGGVQRSRPHNSRDRVASQEEKGKEREMMNLAVALTEWQNMARWTWKKPAKDLTEGQGDPMRFWDKDLGASDTSGNEDCTWS